MINSRHSINPPSDELCKFILNKLNISKSALNLGVKKSNLENAPLPIIMWSYGLINIYQLKTILLWLKDN